LQQKRHKGKENLPLLEQGEIPGSPGRMPPMGLYRLPGAGIAFDLHGHFSPAPWSARFGHCITSFRPFQKSVNKTNSSI